jgi:hypothetical protein
MFGGALGLAVLDALATSRTNSDLKHAAVLTHHARLVALTSGFELAFAVAAGIAFAGGVIALLGLPRMQTRAALRAAEAAPVETVSS